ncbi:MAG: hypothetical protein FJW34_24530 [Acidobacteria bacterium]|nr:hypothetical protein [Acidobacteriota bacterium]
MKTLCAVLRLFPLVLTVVRAVEEAIPLPGQGKKKLDLVLDTIKTVYEGSSELAREFTFEGLVAIVVPMVSRIVDLHNELGLFQKSTPPSQA